MKKRLLELASQEPEIKPELDDINFMEGMKELLGLENEQVEALLDELDSQSLVALADAIAKKDKIAAKNIIGSFEDELSSLFRSKNIEPSKRDDKKKPIKPPKDYEFSIGDDVAIRTPKTNEETGEEDGHEFISATVFKPNAPGKTIGVKIDGKSQMVNRDDVYMLKEDKLKEMVLGMTNMPDLGRMQQLAGIQAQPQTQTEVEVEQVRPSQNDQPMMYDREEEGEMNDMVHCLSALDTLENALPNIRLADVKTIRARINGIVNKMNETLSPGRAKKL